MKKWKISYTFIAILIGGCATSGDLEELGAEIKKYQETLKQDLQEQQNQSEQKNQAAVSEMNKKSEQDLNKIRESLKQQQSDLTSRISELEENQKQQLDMLRNDITTGDEAVKTGLQDKITDVIAELQVQLDNSSKIQESLDIDLKKLSQQLLELEKLQREESQSVAAEIKAINEALNISRSIQDVQVAFGDLKNRLEDSKTRLSTQELLLRQLDGQVSKSERNNLLIEQDIQELEGRMQELLKVLEKREKNSETPIKSDTPIIEENSESLSEGDS